MHIPTIATYFGISLGTAIDMQAHAQHIVFTSRRDTPEQGWGYSIPVWILCTDTLLVLSASFTQREHVLALLQHFSPPPFSPSIAHRIPDMVRSYLPHLKLRHHFIYTTTASHLIHHDHPHVRRLLLSDVPAFIHLSQTIYPAIDIACETTDIQRNIHDQIAFGAFDHEQMVTRCYAPHIAHMQDHVEEVGIETLDSYQGRGYGKAALAGTTAAILACHRIPLYRTSYTNHAAQRIAEAVGYRKIAESFELC